MFLSETDMSKYHEIMKIICFTPLLYPKNKGYTIWNLLNITISMLKENNEYVNKFNANNSAAVFFGALMYHVNHPHTFRLWLKKDNYSLYSEKFVHILPIAYYYVQGYYSSSNILVSILSIFYQYLWTTNCGKNKIDKGDLYYPLHTQLDWYIIWIFIVYGHFFNSSTNCILKGLLMHLTCKLTKLVLPQITQ